MKVWKVLGPKGGLFPPQMMALIGVAFFCSLMFYRGRGRLLVVLVAVLLAYAFGFIVRRLLDGRTEILEILYRALFKRRGSYSLLDRDKPT